MNTLGCFIGNDDFRKKVQVAIGKPENKYKFPYSKTEDKKNNLHIWLIDPKKATDSVIELLKELKIID